MKPNKEMLGTDDWLAREIARESKISAWDLGEGKELRRKHEENCDAREEASKHRSFHQATQHTISTRQSAKKESGNTAKMILGAITALVSLAPLSPILFFIGFIGVIGFVIFSIIKQINQNKGE